jgi:hypothetical protein
MSVSRLTCAQCVSVASCGFVERVAESQSGFEWIIVGTEFMSDGVIARTVCDEYTVLGSWTSMGHRLVRRGAAIIGPAVGGWFGAIDGGWRSRGRGAIDGGWRSRGRGTEMIQPSHEPFRVSITRIYDTVAILPRDGVRCWFCDERT